MMKELAFSPLRETSSDPFLPATIAVLNSDRQSLAPPQSIIARTQ